MSKSFKYDPDSPSATYNRKVKYANRHRTRQQYNRTKIFMESVVRSQESNDDGSAYPKDQYTLAS